MKIILFALPILLLSSCSTGTTDISTATSASGKDITNQVVLPTNIPQNVE